MKMRILIVFLLFLLYGSVLAYNVETSLQQAGDNSDNPRIRHTCQRCGAALVTGNDTIFAYSNTASDTLAGIQIGCEGEEGDTTDLGWFYTSCIIHGMKEHDFHLNYFIGRKIKRQAERKGK